MWRRASLRLILREIEDWICLVEEGWREVGRGREGEGDCLGGIGILAFSL